MLTKLTSDEVVIVCASTIKQFEFENRFIKLNHTDQKSWRDNNVAVNKIKAKVVRCHM
jgi:hypothetical protein